MCIMRTQNVNIRHAENGGEVRIDNFVVNGYDESTKTVYEYYGCYWHQHFCRSEYDTKTWNRTEEREEI